jgi:hypothetical protein
MPMKKYKPEQIVTLLRAGGTPFHTAQANVLEFSD